MNDPSFLNAFSNDPSLHIPYGKVDRAFSERDLRRLQCRAIAGNLNDLDRQDLDAILSFVIGSHIYGGEDPALAVQVKT